MKHKPPDMILFFLVLILLAIGIIMVFSASTSTALLLTKAHPDPYYFLKRQLLWLFLGLCGMVGAYRVPMATVRRASPWLFAGALAMLFLVLVPGIGVVAGGARRWLRFGPLSIQPSEIAKMALVLFIAWFMTRKSATDDISTSFSRTVLPLLFMVLPCLGLVFKEPDFGTAFLMFAVFGLMLCMSGMRAGPLALLASSILPVATVLMLTARYRLARWAAFFNPYKDPLGGGYHIIQGLIALGSGGIWGLGLGAGRQKFFYLPEQHTDYIFAVLGEEGGFVATFFVLLVFVFLGARGMNIALKQKDAYGKLVAGGITAMLVGQALLNMAMVMSLVPPAGIALPFLSYGGSSLFAAMGGVGLLLNLSRSVAGRPGERLQEKIFIERS